MNAQSPVGAPLLGFGQHLALIQNGRALDALAHRRAGQIMMGHTPEADLTKPIAHFTDEVRWRMTALFEIVGRGRMNIPPGRRDQCIGYIESAGGILLALWDRAHIEVPEE